MIFSICFYKLISKRQIYGKKFVWNNLDNPVHKFYKTIFGYIIKTIQYFTACEFALSVSHISSEYFFFGGFK